MMLYTTSKIIMYRHDRAQHIIISRQPYKQQNLPLADGPLAHQHGRNILPLSTRASSQKSTVGAALMAMSGFGNSVISATLLSV